MEFSSVDSRDALIGYIFELLDDQDACGTQWHNKDIYTFLQAMAAWFNDCDGYYKNAGQSRDVDQPSWQLFADALAAASVHE